MVLFILALIVFGVSFALVKNNQTAKFAPLLRGLALVLAIVGISTSCFKQIDAGPVGVKSLFGNIEDDVLPSGLHFVNP